MGLTSSSLELVRRRHRTSFCKRGDLPMTDPTEANQAQAAHWNAAAGATWVEMQGILDDLFAPIAGRLVEAGFPGSGGRVLDIGCGSGAPTLAPGRAPGPQGSRAG